jgi:transposase
MTRPPDLAAKDTIIAARIARIEALTATNARPVARIAELEAKLDQPPQTLNNSSLPPSKGHKARRPGAVRTVQPHLPAERRNFRLDLRYSLVLLRDHAVV